MLKISQIFGPTIQGEGSAAGRHCLFVRVFNCNLECSWCDTAYTWAVTPEKAGRTDSGKLYDRKDPHLGEKEMWTLDVINELKKLWDIENNPTIIVVSGGEPLMQQEGLIPVLEILRSWGNEVHVETAGTIKPNPVFFNLVTQFNVSPKMSNSGNLFTKRFKQGALMELRPKAWFKFVVVDTKDFDEIDSIISTCGISPERVMVMPEGSTPERNISIAKSVIDQALSRGYGLTFRSHVLIWGDDPDK